MTWRQKHLEADVLPEVFIILADLEMFAVLDSACLVWDTLVKEIFNLNESFPG